MSSVRWILLAALAGACGGGGGQQGGESGAEQPGEGGAESGADSEPNPDPDPDPDPAADPDPTAEEDPQATPPPTELTIGQALPVQTRIVADGAFHNVIALPTGWVAEGPDGITLFEEGEGRDLDQGVTGLTAAVRFGEGVLLATQTGLWFAGELGTALSPLNGSVPGVTGLADVGEDLWLAGMSGLHLWRDGQVSAVTPDGLSTDDARIAVSAGVLWVASGEALWRLWSDRAGWQAEVAVAGADHPWLAGADAGAAWASDGTTLRRAGASAVAEYAAPEHRGLAAAGAQVWLWDAESLWRLKDDTLWPVQGAGAPVAVAALGAEAALVATADGLIEVTVGEPPEPQIPTWSGDVLPIFDGRCDICHGQRGNARRLDDQDSFSSQIDLILAAVREQRMPLPPNDPLTDAEIDLIVRWQEAEFPE